MPEMWHWCDALFMYMSSYATKQMTTPTHPKSNKKKKRERKSIETGGSTAAFSQVLLERAEVAVLGAGDGLGVLHVQQRQA